MYTHVYFVTVIIILRIAHLFTQFSQGATRSVSKLKLVHILPHSDPLFLVLPNLWFLSGQIVDIHQIVDRHCGSSSAIREKVLPRAEHFLSPPFVIIQVLYLYRLAWAA
eukprot:SAG31_NODE_8817_length_1382_cov_1.743570_1_plen_109_part_00